MRQIIGVCGRKRTGKDSVARALAARGWHTAALADDVRSFAGHAFGLAPEAFGDDYKEAHIGSLDAAGPAFADGEPWQRALTPRDLLRRCGQAAREVFGDDFWIRRVLGANSRCAQSPLVLVTDVRYLNEAQAIVAAGGQLLRLNRVDAGGSHDYTPLGAGSPADAPCTFVHFQAGSPVCGLPAHAHPTTWTPDRHRTETELPTQSNGAIQYAHVITTRSVEDTVAAAVAWVASTFDMEP